MGSLVGSYQVSRHLARLRRARSRATARVASRMVHEVRGDGNDVTILEVLADLEALGFTGQFMSRDGGQVECLTCHRLSPADETGFRDLRRLEGASHPADL